VRQGHSGEIDEKPQAVEDEVVVHHLHQVMEAFVIDQRSEMAFIGYSPIFRCLFFSN
jgi:hypothetical protein